MLEAICRIFLRIDIGDISRKTLVAWERMCYPGSIGKLNIIYLKKWNKVALLNHLWAMSMKKIHFVD